MPADQAQRASPEALLSLAKKEGRGHLKIFLGAAPGVGKTYAMLGAGRAEIMGGVTLSPVWSKRTAGARRSSCSKASKF